MNEIKQHNYFQPLPENKYNPLSWIHPEVIIGNNCWIGSDVMITDNVVLGDNVSISCGVKIYDHDTSFYRATKGRVQAKHYKVKIGSNTQIGTNSVIVPKNSNIEIGECVIVGALSLVKSSIEPNQIVGGNPLRFIKYVRD